MPQVFKVKNSVEAGKVPAAGDLKTAELALNLADQKLYSKDASNVVFEIGQAGTVVVSEDAPADPATGQLWWADTDENEGGGRLYVWTGTEWVDTSLPGIDSDFDQAQADGLYLSKVNDDTAVGAITFQKVSTHVKGVSVTGGLDGVVGEGLTQYEAGGLGIVAGGKRVLNITNKSVYAVGLKDSLTSNEVGISSQQKLSNLASPSRKYYAYESAPEITGNWWSEINHYYATDLNDSFSTALATGFYSNLSNTTTNASGGARTQYNFYAAGTAPNYFAGTVRVNSTTAQPGFGNKETGIGLAQDNRLMVSTNGAMCMSLNRNNSAGDILQFRYDGNTGTAGYIKIGNATRTIYSCGQNSVSSGFISESDYRLKENIADLVSAVDAVKALKPRTFNYIGSTETVQGFVAHELQEVNTFYATGTKDATENIGTFTDVDGNVQTEVIKPEAIPFGATWAQTGIRDVYQGVDQSKLIPLLTKALQETIAKNEDLEARIAALEGA